MKSQRSKIVMVVCVLGGAWLVWLFQPGPPPKPPDRGAVEIQHGDDITIGDEGEMPALPEGYTPKPGDKVITIKAKEDIPAGTEIKILVPADAPAMILGEEGKVDPDVKSFEVIQQEFSNPWFHLHPEVIAGFSLNRYLEPSPIAMCSVLELFSLVRLGGAVDRFGLGPSVAVEFMENLAAVGKWNLVEWHDRPAQISIGVGYVF